jgi:hypothetical protein
VAGQVANSNYGRFLGIGGVLIGAMALSACGPKEKPKPVPPPPVVIVPPQPFAPLGAQANMTTPPVDANGVRRTINTGITQAQATWSLRSAYNVAALNCTRPEHAGILENYKVYLKSHAKALTATNKALDKEFKDRIGTSYIKAREAYMTQVYNYFALPPTLPLFCDAALSVSNDLRTVKSADLDSASAAGLIRLDQVFKDFFTGYDQYRVDLAAWQARYAPVQNPTVSAAAGVSLPAAAQPQAQ